MGLIRVPAIMLCSDISRRNVLLGKANIPFKSLFGERVCAGVDSLIKIPLIMIARCAFLFAAADEHSEFIDHR